MPSEMQVYEFNDDLISIGLKTRGSILIPKEDYMLIAEIDDRMLEAIFDNALLDYYKEKKQMLQWAENK